MLTHVARRVLDACANKAVLYEACWFHIYILALAASLLLFFVLGTKCGPTIEESTATALKACELLERLAQFNPSARRSYESIITLIRGLQQTSEAEEGGGTFAAQISRLTRIEEAWGKVGEERAEGVEDVEEEENDDNDTEELESRAHSRSSSNGDVQIDM